MKVFIFSLLLSILSASHSPDFNKSACTCKGVFLSGVVKTVDFNPDFRVRIVDGCEDLTVHSSPFATPTSCGQWHFDNERPADFSVQFVEYGEDFTIRIVN